MQNTDNLQISSTIIPNNFDFDSFLEECTLEQYDINDFPTLIASIKSQDRMKQHFGIIGLVKILSNENFPELDAITEAALIPRFIYFLRRDDEPILQIQSAFALAHLASGNISQAQLLVEHGAIPILVSLLNSKNSELIDSAVWAIANISADCKYTREIIVKNGGFEALIEFINNPPSVDTYKAAAKTLANVIKQRSEYHIEELKYTISILAKALDQEHDPEIIADLISILSNIIRPNEKYIQIFLDLGLAKILMKQLENELYIVLLPSIKVVSDMLSGNAKQADLMLSLNPIPIFLRLLDYDDIIIRCEMCLLIGNLASRGCKEIEIIINNTALIEKLIKMSIDDFLVVRRRSVRALTNCILDGSLIQKESLLKQGILNLYFLIMRSDLEIILVLALSAILDLMKSGEQLVSVFGSNIFMEYILQYDGYAKVKQFENHQNFNIKKLVIDIFNFMEKKQEDAI